MSVRLNVNYLLSPAILFFEFVFRTVTSIKRIERRCTFMIFRIHSIVRRLVNHRSAIGTPILFTTRTSRSNSGHKRYESIGVRRPGVCVCNCVRKTDENTDNNYNRLFCGVRYCVMFTVFGVKTLRPNTVALRLERSVRRSRSVTARDIRNGVE